MKKFLIVFLQVFFCMSLYAEKIPLVVKPPTGKGSGKITNKELILVPSASIEDGVINIETAMASWGVTVTIYNGDGAVCILL